MKAYVGRNIPTEAKNRVISLLGYYGEISVLSFSILYYWRYDEWFNIAEYNLDTGLRGFLELLQEQGHVTLKQNSNNDWMCHSNSRLTECSKRPQFNQDDSKTVKRPRNGIEIHIFNPAHTDLWAHYSTLLDMKKVKIASSPLELALESRPYEMGVLIKSIHTVMSAHPEGISVSALSNYISFDKRLLSVKSIAEATVEYPELFYRVEPEKDGLEAIIYDGTNNTHDDLKGERINHFALNSAKLVCKTILSGMYQKTLVLIREAGSDGLKLAIWRKTVTDRSNFNLNKKYANYESDVLQMDPLVLFQILSFYKLVELKSHPLSMNDLRIHFSEKVIDYRKFLKAVGARSRQIDMAQRKLTAHMEDESKMTEDPQENYD